MNWEEYKELSEKTLSKEFYLDKTDEFLLHSVAGVITELQELTECGDDVNKKEEVADCFWYIALIDRTLNMNLSILSDTELSVYSELKNISNESLILQSYSKCSLLMDFLKKKMFYNKPIDFDEFSDISTQLFDILSLFCKNNDINISSILETNINKLKARYGDKFNSEKAINRDLETERTILEK
jgi:NTP pyrophosphatase (non-canonical NTP hydrolase)